MTLAFSWATNANYSTGPNVGFPTKVDPASTANGFVNGTIAAAQHINFLFDAVGDQIVKAVDGVDGGTYTLGSALRFQGADVEINAGLEILAAGELNVQPSSELNIAAGALLDMAGAMVVGGILTIDTGGSLEVVGGTLLAAESEKLTIDDAANFFRLNLTPQSIQPDTGGTDPSWTPLAGGPFEGTALGWSQLDVGAQFMITFPLNLPVGDDIVTVVASVDGSITGVGHAAKPVGGDLPVLSLVRVSTTGAVTVLARRADQAADVTAYNAQHTITLASGGLDAGSLPVTVDDDFAYYIVLTGATGANAEAGKYGVTSISGTCTARAYRSALMVY